MKHFSKKRILYWCISLVLFALFVVAFCILQRPEKKTYAPDMVILGDSIFAYTQGADSVAQKLENRMFLHVEDLSLGGSMAAYADSSGRLAKTTDACSLASLSLAICSGDFRYQHQADIRMSGTDYFEDRLGTLEQIDFSKVQILLIEHQLNDYQFEIPLSDGDGSESTYTYIGALRESVVALQKAYPNLRIVLVSSPFVWYPQMGTNGQIRDFGYGTLEDFVAAQGVLAKELGVEWIDLYHGVYERTGQEDWELYTVDGIHLNETGRELVAQEIANYFAENEE